MQKYLLAVMLLGVTLTMGAQVNNTRLKSKLNDYFVNYKNSAFENSMKYVLESVMTSEANRTVEIYANEVFGMQPFTPQLVEDIHQKIKLLLPSPYDTYTLTIYAAGKNIRDLITPAWTNQTAQDRYWGKTSYTGLPWVQNLSIANKNTGGLQGRHLSLWASHGKYYANGDQMWKWQRPHLFCTTEDLLTQSIAVPFLYPMLERAGAIVFTPRERDWQRHEVVIDNDFPNDNGQFQTTKGKSEWELFLPGFSNKHKLLTDFDDPHHEGTSLIIPAQDNEKNASTATWTPLIPEDGDYSVYVSYPVIPLAVPDAEYTICHAGTITTIHVNQQMGGSTWVYLGTFDFKAGQSTKNYISLSNHSQHKGFVGADAIRLGGGMSHVVRADLQRDILNVLKGSTTASGEEIVSGSIMKPNGEIVLPNTGFIEHADSLFQETDTTVQILQYRYTNNLIGSGLPRHLEAARYTTQWLGLTRDKFGIKDGTYDYGDDINARPIATNYLARGSVYLPGDSGLCVPLELNLALHSDAGYKRNFEYIGSLAIHTSDFDNGLLPGGQNRLASRDLCDILLQQVHNDLTMHYGTWTRRQIFDRNYGETRIPRIPSAILEMFSHQNYADMVRALDPSFKFTLARSIYKGILRYVHLQHHGSTLASQPIVAPLPVNSFYVQSDPINQRIRLTWQPTIDLTESSATPTAYIVYTRTKDMGWDNGTVIKENACDFRPHDDQIYQFRVEAINEGGRSMPSETLCARLCSTPTAPNILIVNGFQRIASPQAVCSKDSCGFDMLQDPGVPYIHTTEFCGRQLYFGWDGIGKETSKGMGYSGTELEGMLVKGNTFDYPILHAQDIASSIDCNISSCSRASIENGTTPMGAYQLVDIIMGAQRRDGYSSHEYKTFSAPLRQALIDFTEKGGSLLVSGAYIGTDMAEAEEEAFTDRVLHYRQDGEVRAEMGILDIEGMQTKASYLMQPNEKHLSTAYVSGLKPDKRAFATLVYSNKQCAGVAYKGADYSSIALGFPIEQIQEDDVRRLLMQGFLGFLLQK